MSTPIFLISMLMALLAPLLAMAYLRPILLKVLRSMCDADGGAEFWLRSAYVLAICGSLLLMLTFGNFSDTASVVDMLRRAFWLALAGVFLTVGFIVRQVWAQIRPILPLRPAARLPHPTGEPS
jgi:quinol-cytochrome oxidoreductase complex cytochrome b subunit